ncbi:hypothetical protein NDN13_19720 [Acinetobacter sp. C32I]|nr:hypothetical protein [Acinetobacter sp. C32I]USA53621.1 hypothetical protein NDN13_19720 [Acinetobacter sp. C32I]
MAILAVLYRMVVTTVDIKLAETVNLGTNGSVTTGTKIDNSGDYCGMLPIRELMANKNSVMLQQRLLIKPVNKGQLDAATTAADTKTDNLGNSTANNLGGGSTYDNTTGTVSAPNYVTTKTDGSTTQPTMWVMH